MTHRVVLDAGGQFTNIARSGSGRWTGVRKICVDRARH